MSSVEGDIQGDRDDMEAVGHGDSTGAKVCLPYINFIITLA